MCSQLVPLSDKGPPMSVGSPHLMRGGEAVGRARSRFLEGCWHQGALVGGREQGQMGNFIFTGAGSSGFPDSWRASGESEARVEGTSREEVSRAQPRGRCLERGTHSCVPKPAAQSGQPLPAPRAS